ncbi:hypothetical protein RJ640_002362 [Escallonia rubra]|uniref:UDP-glucose:glycoprotein glucosyltransferase n=1 Tax=Escallonia rubra TaxID=112253 RepID=A0AA88QAH6_9ASTE|nr:hypothetical protein RJ640_002362 [Escallonia rubra]
MEPRLRSGFWVLSSLIAVALCISLCGYPVSAETRRPKNVQVALRAKWPGTPLLLEAGELLSREWKDLFWEFIEVWLHTENRDSDSYTAKDCLKKIVNYGRSLLSEHLASVFEFSVTLRSASPKLVLYQQLAEESLSSFPLSDDISSVEGGISESHENREVKKPDSLLVGANPRSPGGKCCWVDTGGALLFDVTELLLWLRRPDEVARDTFQQPELFEFDHIHVDSSIGSPVAILYGALGTDCFKEFHLTLVEAAKEGKVKYVVRPILPSGCESKSSHCGAIGTRAPLNLGGYGVELALKNMEYKAMDDSAIKKGVTLEDAHTEDLSQEVRGFIFSRILERKPELTSEIMAFRDYLLSSTVSDTLNVWELKDLGHQTAQKIVHASDPLQSMQEINQNFPSVVSSLSRMKLNDSIKDEITANQRMIPPGKSLMALNESLSGKDQLLAPELKELTALRNIPPSAVRKLLSTLPPPESNMFRVDFRSTHVQFLNNLEEDSMYRQWRSNLNEILMPVYPGQLRYIRKNLFHAVYVLDPASICGLETIDTIISLFENNLPVRFGVVLYSTKFIQKIETNGGELPFAPVDNDSQFGEDLSSLIMRLFIYIKENHGTQMAFQFLSNVNKLRIDSADSAEDAPEMHHVEGAFVETLLPKAKSPPQDTLLKLEKEQTFNELSEESSMFIFKLGLAKLQCCLLMNGLVHEPNEEALLNAMNEELPRIQEQVYYGHINSHTDVLDKFLSESGIQRYNPQIIGDGKVKPKFISLSASVIGKNSVLSEINYLHSPETIDDVKPVTHLLAVDVTSKKGMKLLHEGIRYLMAGSRNARLGMLFNSNPDADLASLLFVQAFEISASSYSHKKRVLDFLDQLCSFYEVEYMHASSLDAESNQALIDKVSELADANGLPSKSYKSALIELSADKLRSHLDKVGKFLYRQLGLGFGVNAVITNGRVTDPIFGGTLLSHDLHLLESMEFKQRIKHILEIIEEVKWEEIDPDMLTSKFISDIIMSVSSSIATRDRSSESARFEILSAKYSAVILNNENSSIHIDAVIDPLSPSGQKLSSLLRILWKSIQPSMRLVLNPLDDFSSSDLTVYGPKAFFANMPLTKTLTMNLDVPEPWLVQPVVAVHDLDNMLLENLGETRTLQAVYELEALVLTGHCAEKEHEPPRGLQLILGTKSTPHLVDTLVMANLGYWQMKVSPGVWYLQLAPGRSSELYVLKEDGDGSQGMLSTKRITIKDLRGKPVHLEVLKKKGKEHEKLLVSSDDNSHSHKKETQNIWNSNLLKWASGIIGGNEQSRNHKSTSMDLIPHMAQEYDFEYELITYKWPSWLHKQKEKQRIIWAYKILFLDVIFPLSLEKVIFVDADQIVRADMGELYDMDLRGRPLGYTPFCDNNKEMDGYRFWRQGFWKEHLRGRPYHIRLFQYFINHITDIDLPNYAQHTVPIFSLPQEWLWCESWCGNSTKSKAKTIDLCNNPMTKEPKLHGAKRIVAEWPDLDLEARHFTAKISGEDVGPLEPAASQNSVSDHPSEDKESMSEL